MGFDLSSGASLSRQRLPEVLVPTQAVSPLPQKPLSEKVSSEGEERGKVPPAVLTPAEIQRVREKFEPLRPVLQAALDGLSDLGRELRNLLQSSASQAESPSASVSQEQGAARPVPDPSFKPSLTSPPSPSIAPPPSGNDGQAVRREGTRSIPEDGNRIEAGNGIVIPGAQQGPGVEPRPPQGIPVTGGLPVILPGQSQPAPSPDPIFGSGEDGRRRVGLQSDGVARVGNSQDEVREFQLRLREREVTHLFILSQEAIRLVGQVPPLAFQSDFKVQTDDFQGEISESIIPERAGEFVAKSTIGGDNDPDQKTLLESIRELELQGEERERGTVGAPPEEPPLSRLERPEPPLPTNTRSRFVPVNAVNLLDLVL